MVDLARGEEFEEWLRSIPTTTVRAFATRAALQVLPYAFDLSYPGNSSFELQKLLLACLRANVVSGLVGIGKNPETNSLTINALSTLNAANNTGALSTLSDPNDTVTAVAATFYTSRTDAEQTIHDLLANSVTHGIDAVQALTADADALSAAPEDTEQLFATQLWHGEVPEPFADLTQKFLDTAPGTPWEFWADWYEGMLKGEPLDWELQRRVALIENSIWMAGPEAVAEEIEKIQARRHVELTLAELNDSFKAQPLSRLGIGGNNPPKDKQLAQSLTLIWTATEELSDTLEQDNPKRERVEKILEKLKAGRLSLTNWIGRKADLAVDTAIATAIKQGGPLLVSYYLLDKLIKAIEGWLPFLF